MLEKFNSKQQEAILAENKAILVIAGAGSGKTSVLTQRIMHLIQDKGVSPSNILAVTFTNKAANEMKERTLNLFRERERYFESYSLWIGTFHSICVRILRKHIDRLGFQSSFTIYDKNESVRLIRKCLKEMDLNPKQYRINQIYSLVESAKNKLIDEKQFYDESIGFYQKTVGKIFIKYQEELFKNQALDYGDLIQKTVFLFNENRDLLEYYQKKFLHILVDEYQDINHTQYRLIQLLSGKENCLFVVGDPDQSIYRFRGAEIDNIIHFEEDFPESQVIKLEQNYRSSEMILKGAAYVIQNNHYRKDKKLWTEKKGGEKIKYYEAGSAEDEADFIAREILRIKNKDKREWNDFAVLYRTNAQSRSFEESFGKRQIPFKVIGGIKFYQRKEIKDLISLLKIINNPYDRGNYRHWLEIEKLGIGAKGFQVLSNRADLENKSILQILPNFLETTGNRISQRNRERIFKYLDIFVQLKGKASQLSIFELTEKLITNTQYLELLQNDPDRIKAANKIDNVKDFLQSIKEYETQNTQSDLGYFLNYMSLVSEVDELNSEAEAKMVSIMTLHCAKGLEFPIVFLSGLEEGIFPHIRSITNPRDLEEERRLCYVGMTRAMDVLYVTHCWRRNTEGQTKYNLVSRFFNEIPKEFLQKASLENFKNLATGDFFNTSQIQNKSSSIWENDMIVHEHWGEGQVVSKKKAGDDYYLTVHFRGKGIKRLSLKYAPIKKIKEES